MKFLILSLFVITLGLSELAYCNSLYNVTRAVTTESVSSRQRAFNQGLDEIFVRISGNADIMNKLKRPAVKPYIKAYHYSPLQNKKLNKDGKQLKYNINIQYNHGLIENHLREKGYPVWSGQRADLVIWLLIDEGKEEYLLKEIDASPIKTHLVELLRYRGIAVRWPQFDYEDKLNISFDKIRQQEKNTVISASKRYSSGPVVSASMKWDGKNWQSVWSLFMASKTQQWQINQSNSQLIVDEVAPHIANTMGRVFAIKDLAVDSSSSKAQIKKKTNGQLPLNSTIKLPATTLPTVSTTAVVGNSVLNDSMQVQRSNNRITSYFIEVEPIDSIAKYGFVERYLTGLSAVSQVTALQVRGERAQFEVTLRSDLPSFLNLVENDGKLTKIIPPVVPSKTSSVVSASRQQNLQVNKIDPQKIQMIPIQIKKVFYYHLNSIK